MRHIVETRPDLEGKKLQCIKKKYGNIKHGKVYDLIVRFRKSNGQPSYYQIVDEDGDYYTIGQGEIGTLFEIVEEE